MRTCPITIDSRRAQREKTIRSTRAQTYETNEQIKRNQLQLALTNACMRELRKHKNWVQESILLTEKAIFKSFFGNTAGGLYY